MLRIHSSNRIEVLAQALTDRLAAAPGDVFVADAVIVPSLGVRRWLTLAIAGAQGVCAQVEFPFLGPWLWKQVLTLLPEGAALAPLDPAVLGWRIHAAFGERGFTGAHPRLAAYLAGADDLMRWQLARRTASVMDQYATYRPDWLAAWRAGQAVDLGAASATRCADERWQAELWRRLAGGAEAAGAAGRGDGRSGSAAAALIATLGCLDAAQARAAGLPASAQVFCLPAMPPLHLQLLAALGRLMQIEVYALNPCQEYWTELVGPRRLHRLAAAGREAGHEVGNRLLAGWGRQTQALVDGLVEVAGEDATDDADFRAAGAPTMLAALQDAILELRELAPGSIVPAADDRSIEVHVGHSRTRELEALHDHLLGLLASGALSHPSQALVVTPDLDAAAPLIDAVFGTVPTERWLPYRISGRARSRANAAAAALLALLDLAGSRFAASEVAALLRHDGVARRFGFDAEALERVHAWLGEAGIRWGLDAGHRAALGLPATGGHSWAQGLERLMLGFALPDGAAQPFAGIVAVGDARGSAARPLGLLWRFVQRLARWRAAVAAPLPAGVWPTLLRQALEDFHVPQGDEIDDAGDLRDAIAALADAWRRAGYDEPGAPAIPLALARAALAAQLDDPPHGGVATGGVTFTAMGSLRALPFEVVCVIGLDDGAFPGGQRPAEFDLIAAAPRRGDRQRRDDDRNLFLDLLLAARRSVYLSHVGRSQRDNAPLPPSVVVAELLDVLVPAVAADPCSAEGLARAHARLVVEHPLQPFSVEAFTPGADPRRRSFDADWAAALRLSLAAPLARVTAEALAGVQGDAGEDADAPDDDGGGEEVDRDDARLPVFVTQALPPPPPEWRTPTLAQLAEFFRNPSAYLLRRRLRIDLFRIDDDLLDDEPFVADDAARRALAARVLDPLIAGADPAAVRVLARAGSEFPAGTLGERMLDAALDELRAFADRVRTRQQAAGPVADPYTVRLPFDLDGESWVLDAAFADLRAQGLVRWRAGKLQPRDRLDAWLAHLVLAAAPPPGWSGHSRQLALDGELVLAPPRRPATGLLGGLLALYRRGLSAPLPFFPRAAWACVQRQGSMAAARQAFEPRAAGRFAERDDAAHALAWRGVADPLGGDFQALAVEVFAPLVHAVEDAA